ncbi:UNVERIFIED_CONTAM: hypothetical protein GTU68_032344, partial [Idotea baltica]|nr:hypothetical protein [Idotea baltica]
MKRVKLIGGSGFVGSRFLDSYRDAGDFSNFDKRPSIKHSDISSIGDVRNQDQLNSTFSDTDIVVLLAAEHRDDVSPTSAYYDVNVQGTKNVLQAMDANGISKIVFTSSVAVYGLNKKNPDESHAQDPFNHYGKSKWQAEEVLREWYQKDPNNRSLVIIRPTVIFGERNRGNVYNLLKQISSGKFMMVGKGKNLKSMAYVGNIVAFIKHHLDSMNPGCQIFNYIDKPDFSMNELVGQVEKSLTMKIPSFHLPYLVGMLGGYCFDALSLISRKKFSVSSVRVKKFCATTQFDATKAHQSGFKAPFSLQVGLDRTL